jgi:hypothetical protein
MLRLRRQVVCDVMRDGEQMLPVIPCFGILEQVQYLGGSSRLIHKSRKFYGLVGGLVGIYFSSTAALAEVEEISEDMGRSNGSISTLSSGLSMEPLIDNYDNISDKGVDIPETVWSLHSRGPVHLDRIRDGAESQIYTGSDAHFESPTLWTRTAVALWYANSIYESAALLPLTSLKFQSASCGGNQAEHKDLDYCSLRSEEMLLQEYYSEYMLLQEYSLARSSGIDNDTLDNASNVVTSATNSGSSSSNNQSVSSANSQPATFLPTSTATGNTLSQGDLIVLEQCGGASGVCAIASIDLPVTPVDSPATDVLATATDVPSPATDVLAQPTDVPSPATDVLAQPTVVLAPPINLPLPVAPPPTQITLLDNPEPGSDLAPVFTPSPLRPIPEASTWIMTVIGFGAMVITYGRRDRHRIKQIVATTVRSLINP